MLSEINAGYGRKGNRIMAIFHFTVKIVGRSKGKSVISASAYLNGDVMKNEETGRISYYTSKKEVVYTSLMMCENAPPEWLHVPEENIKRFQQSIRYKRADDKEAALEKFKITFQKQRLWNEVLKIEKNADAQLGRLFEFSLPKEWSRQEQIDYTTEYIQKDFRGQGNVCRLEHTRQGRWKPTCAFTCNHATIQSRPLMGQQRSQGLGFCQR
ncbi:MobA/MobL protein, partial [human gut metagenome]